jgi:hypothetical protein
MEASKLAEKALDWTLQKWIVSQGRGDLASRKLSVAFFAVLAK